MKTGFKKFLKETSNSPLAIGDTVTPKDRLDVLIGSKYIRLTHGEKFKVVKAEKYKVMIQVGSNTFSWVIVDRLKKI